MLSFSNNGAGVRKKEAGRELDDRIYDEFPERQQIPVTDFELDGKFWNSWKQN